MLYQISRKSEQTPPASASTQRTNSASIMPLVRWLLPVFSVMIEIIGKVCQGA